MKTLIGTGGGKRKVSTRDPIFGGNCIPKPLPLKDKSITRVPQAALKIKRAKIGVHGTRSGKMWVKMGGNRLK